MRRAILGLLSAAAVGAILALSAGCEPAGSRLGKKIYIDGVGADGALAYTHGPGWMRYAGTGCVVCHGPRGEGLVVAAGGVTGAAPAVKWAALAARGYDRTTLRRALTEGVDPHGRELQDYMPRWELSDEELDALLAYLKAL